MTIYGTELSFTVPTTADAFGDQFDAATAHLGVDQGIYSLDAVLSGDEMFVLVGVNVPDDVEPQGFFSDVMTTSVIPALVSAGVSHSAIKATADQTALVFA